MIRVVEVNGRSVPREVGVAPGANAVVVMPGHHIVRLMYVVNAGQWDVHTYYNLPITAKSNCRYQVVAFITNAVENPRKLEDLDIKFVVSAESINKAVRTDCESASNAGGYAL